MEDRRFWLYTALGLALLFAVLAWMGSRYYIDRKIAFASDRLQLLGELRGAALQDYLATAKAELRFWSTDPVLVNKLLEMEAGMLRHNNEGADMMPGLRQYYSQQNPFPEADGELIDDASVKAYSGWHAGFHPLASLFVSERGYYDFIMIGDSGNVFYSAEKETDFATNLNTGPWRETPLADVFRRVMHNAKEGRDTVVISDFRSYEPSAGEPAMFMGAALRNEQGALRAVVVFQLPTTEIHEIMQVTSGMGETGETYLVGADQLMRSDSRFSEESTVLKLAVDTETSRLALAGEAGVRFTMDYRGVEVLSAYGPVQMDEHQWAVMAEMDREEILRAAARDRPALGALMLFFYGFSLWSVWYVRSAGPDGEGLALADLDFDSDLS